MNKKRKLTKRIVAWLMCLAMVLTTVNLPVFTKEVKAAPAPTTQEPSITAFATKTDLVNPNNFTLHKDNGSGVAQKVNFGKEKTWYIAGAQNEGAELVLICDPSKSFDTKAFSASTSEKAYESSMGTYEGATAPTNVYSNHYGASEVRDYLTKLYGDDNVEVFSSAEQKLMKDTTVYTKDTKNESDDGSSLIYSTSDKLYFAYGDYDDATYITVGANNNSDLNGGIKIGLKGDNSPSDSPYASSGWFWLRAPHDSFGFAALGANQGNSVDGSYVNFDSLVVPAFNMNLSSVLFASAATAVSPDATLSTAMTFRMNGEDKVQSSAIACTGNIYVIKSTNDNEYLYVQGKDEETDWVYSKEITADETVTTEDIKTAESLANIDLTKCKIWIETTDDNVPYAKEIVAQGDHVFTAEDGTPLKQCKMCGKNAPSPLIFTAEAANSSVTFDWGEADYVKVSRDGGSTWSDYTKGTAIVLEKVGDKVEFKGENVETGSEHHFSMTGKIAASGDVTALTNGKGGDVTLTSTCCYENMFDSCTSLTSAPNLPSTTLSNSCYYSMFYGCTALTSAPDLPATTLAGSCYFRMFEKCTALIKAPKLPATTLKRECYNSMFNKCTSLTEAPELPAETMEYTEDGEKKYAIACYELMFYDCESLIKAPELPVVTLAKDCYHSMFEGCKNLEEAPSILPATKLAEFCYSQMFKDCEKLEKAPTELSATTMEYCSCTNMFENCKSLTDIPQLKATTLAESCYSGMFAGCTSIKVVPELPVASLAVNCYHAMFYDCVNLKAIPSFKVTNWSEADGAFINMFYGCTKLAISETKDEDYNIPWKLEGPGPESYKNIEDYEKGYSMALYGMFDRCSFDFSVMDEEEGGVYTYPTPNKTYYLKTYRYDITTKDDEKGNVKVDKTRAEEGETVKLNVTPSDEYCFDKWVSDDVEIKNETSKEEAYFVMPDKDVIISATYNNHTGGTATCTERAICSTCGEPYGELKQHDFSEQPYLSDGAGKHYQICKACPAESEHVSCKDTLKPVTKIDATCEVAGNIAYYICEKCGTYYSDAEATTVISKDSVVIAATKHSLSKVEKVDATCTSAGCKEYWKCTNDDCGKIFADKDGNTETTLLDLAIAAKGHTWNTEYTVDVEPTTEAEGSKSIHCSICGEIKEGSTVTIPKIEVEKPISTPTASPSATPEVTPTASPSATPEVTPTASPIGTPEATPTASPSATPEVTPTASPIGTPEATPTASPSATPEVTPTVSPSATPEATPTASPSATPEVTPTASPSATPEVTPTVSPSGVPSGKPSEAVYKPVKVTIVSAKNNKKKTITIKIKAAKNAKKYKVQYATDKKFKKLKTITTKKLTITLKKLKKKKTYYIRICGVNGKQVGPWSNVKKVKVKK